MIVKDVLRRLESVGYDSVAFVHTVYGTPRKDRDAVDVAFAHVQVVLDQAQAQGRAKEANESVGKKRERPPSSASSTPIRILKRLHAVVENASDIGFYVNNNNNSKNSSKNSQGPRDQKEEKDHDLWLSEYDLVSMSPRNDVAFDTACISGLAPGTILTLDYTAGRGGVQLPFRIKNSHVKEVVTRGLCFEIPYGPAILEPAKRKGLIQAARLLQANSVGRNVRLVVSAGSHNVMALRSPSDMMNVVQTVLQFDPTTASNCFSRNASYAIDSTKHEWFGSGGRVVDVVVGEVPVRDAESKPIETNDDDNNLDGDDENQKKEETEIAMGLNNNDDDDGDNVEDGFIQF